MKKLLKYISFCLVAVFCLIVSFGCSCSTTPLKIKFGVEVKNEDPLRENIIGVSTTIKVYTKYREPADTACYEKVEGEYVLIPNSEGVSSCYDSEGNWFEKATYKNTDKKLLYTTTFDSKYNVNDGVASLILDSYEISDDGYGLLFEVTVENRESEDIYIKGFDIDDIVGDLIVAESMHKVNDYYTFPAVDDYYKLDGVKLGSIYDRVTFKFELKGLTNAEAKDKAKEISLNMPIVVKVGE